LRLRRRKRNARPKTSATPQIGPTTAPATKAPETPLFPLDEDGDVKGTAGVIDVLDEIAEEEAVGDVVTGDVVLAADETVNGAAELDVCTREVGVV
jgi:hypothetical protein